MSRRSMLLSSFAAALGVTATAAVRARPAAAQPAGRAGEPESPSRRRPIGIGHIA